MTAGTQQRPVGPTGEARAARRPPRRPSGRIATLLAVGALVLAACGSSQTGTEGSMGSAAESGASSAEGSAASPPAASDGGGSTPAETTSVTMQLAWLKNMQFVGEFAGIDRGHFADQGLEMELQAGGPSVDAIDVVTSGQAMVGLADSNEIAVARGKGLPIKAFGAAFQKSPFSLISLADSKLETLEDQYGKTVAVSDASRPIVRGLMEREGLDPEKVTFVPKNPDPSVLASGQVDGYWGFLSTEAAVLEARDVQTYAVTLSDLGEPTYSNVLFATEETFANNRDTLMSLLKADIAGWDWALENPDASAEMVLDGYAGTEIEPAVAKQQARMQKRLIATGDAEENGLFWIDPEVFEDNIENAVDAGLLEESYPVDKVVTQELIKAVHDE